MERDRISGRTRRVALNILFIQHNAKTIRAAYRSEHNNKCKKQVILLMITDGKKRLYLAVTNLSALLKGNSSNHKGDFYCLNCFSSYTTKNKHKEHEEICNNQDSSLIKIPNWVEKILKYNSGEKSLKASFVIYLDFIKKCLLKKRTILSKESQISYTEKKARHEPSDWAMFTRYSFDKKENELNY